ncbi:pitrilysin family protein [Leptobacterium sp. I13]|uniref:M16 family metallopeptidase n=1 Tax=Leptobacterium meishanense TaxID=3128904 RepID=UPI0030EBA22E
MKKLFIIYFLLFLAIPLVSAQEKELPPKGGEPKDFALPDREEITLDNGLKIVLAPYGAIPKATIRMVVKTGNIHETENEIWLSDLVGSMMQEGTSEFNAKQLADKMARMGGDLNVFVNQHTANISSAVLYEFAPDAINLMAKVLTAPSFPESELDRLKGNLKRNLSVALTRPRAQASASFYKGLYPDHAYGRIYPTQEMIDSYTVEQVNSFYDNQFGAKRTTVYVAGKFDRDKVINTIKNAFNTWKEGPEDTYPIATPATFDNLTIQITDRPNAPQSTIYYGLPVADVSNSDYIALDVTNSLLGGSFGSRITSNIREDKGYTYSPSSRLDNKYKSGIWMEVADVTTEHTAASLEEIKNEIIRLQNEPPSKEELAGIQNYESGLFVLRNSSPGGIINQLVFIDIHDMDDSYLKNRVNNIMKLTPEDIQNMTKKYINPENMNLVIVGDKEKVEKQLKEKSIPIKD